MTSQWKPCRLLETVRITDSEVSPFCDWVTSGNLGELSRSQGFFFFKSLKIILFFIYGCAGSLMLREGFLLLWRAGDYSGLQCTGSLVWLLLRRTGSRLTGFRSCDSWAQQLRLAGSVAVKHGLNRPSACGISSWIWDRTRAPCAGSGLLANEPSA